MFSEIKSGQNASNRPPHKHLSKTNLQDIKKLVLFPLLCKSGTPLNIPKARYCKGYKCGVDSSVNIVVLEIPTYTVKPEVKSKKRFEVRMLVLRAAVTSILSCLV